MKKIKIGIVGLGYVGLPLAVLFSKRFKVLGYDIDSKRISKLQKGIDDTFEVKSQELLKNKKKLSFSSNPKSLKDCNFYILTVPTPIYKNKKPDLSFLKKATSLVGEYLNKGDYVIYESTVYPGVTEDFCLPILEKISKLKVNKDFYIGYSPERINPGDKKIKLKDIVKIVSASNEYSLKNIKKIYNSVIEAGIYKAKSIKVAEAAKVIENTQRDINIALMNDLSSLFQILGLKTKDVLDAAKTKWNFIPFEPGFVGGHCIGVDPYYLTHLAKEIGHNPNFILSGRKINDNKIIKETKSFLNSLKKNRNPESKNLEILIMGATFKENCPDVRNSKIIDAYDYLKKKGASVEVFDPIADKKLLKKMYGIDLLTSLPKKTFSGVMILVSHDAFKKIGEKKISRLCNDKKYIYDAKSIFCNNEFQSL